MFGVLRPNSPGHEHVQMSPDDSSPPPMSMAAPPPGEFGSREELLESMKLWAENQGYAVVIGRSRVNRLWIKCDRGGKYEDKHADHPEMRKRKRGESRLTDCPFRVHANVKKDGIWRCRTENANHNHEPSEDLSVHPSLRRMTDEQLQKVNEMTEAGNTPVETLEELQRLWPGIKVLRRDIYNARKKYKTEKELAEVAQGLHLPQPFQDPNGIMPGPTRTGRWEWIEEGDEIKRKKRKKLSLPVQSLLAPELRDPESPVQLPQPATRRQAASLGNLPPKPFVAAQPISAQQRRAMAPQVQTTNATTDGDNGVSGSSMRFRSYNPTPSRDRSGSTPSQHNVLQGPPSNVATQAVNGNVETPAPVLNGGPTAPKTNPSGQVLMSRIERMEKEQRDQKNMLAQILGAVQGIR
jgi:hypothetical protein